MWNRRSWMMLGAISGLLAVAIGAFAAHGVTDPQAKDWLKTGSTYQFFHTLAVFACGTVITAGGKGARFAPALFLGGILLFSGSLYVMALGGPRILGAVTPLGGLLFMAGWLVLAWSARKVDPA